MVPPITQLSGPDLEYSPVSDDLPHHLKLIHPTAMLEELRDWSLVTLPRLDCHEITAGCPYLQYPLSSLIQGRLILITYTEPDAKGYISQPALQLGVCM